MAKVSIKSKRWNICTPAFLFAGNRSAKIYLHYIQYTRWLACNFLMLLPEEKQQQKKTKNKILYEIDETQAQFTILFA